MVKKKKIVKKTKQILYLGVIKLLDLIIPVLDVKIVSLAQFKFHGMTDNSFRSKYFFLAVL